MVGVLDSLLTITAKPGSPEVPTEFTPSEKSTPEEIEEQIVADISALEQSGVFSQKGHLRMIENKLRILYGTIGIAGTREAFGNIFPPIDERSNPQSLLLASEVATEIHSQLGDGTYESNEGMIIINPPGRQPVAMPAEIFLTARNERSYTEPRKPYKKTTLEQILFGIHYALQGKNAARYQAVARLRHAGHESRISNRTPEDLSDWIRTRGDIHWTEDVLAPFAEYFSSKEVTRVDYQDIYMELRDKPLFREHVTGAEEYQPGDPLPPRAMYLIRNAINHLREREYPNIPLPMKDINWNKLLFNESNEEFTVGEDFISNLAGEYQQWCLGKDKDISGDTNEIVTGLVEKVVLTGHLPVELREPLIAALGNRYGIEPSPKSIRFQLCHFDKNVRIPPLMQALANLVGIEHERIHSEKEPQIEHDWEQLMDAAQLNPEIYKDLRRYIEGEPNRKLPRNLHDTLVEICNDKGITPPSINAVRRYILAQRQGYLAQQKRILTEEV